MSEAGSKDKLKGTWVKQKSGNISCKTQGERKHGTAIHRRWSMWLTLTQRKQMVRGGMGCLRERMKEWND